MNSIFTVHSHHEVDVFLSSIFAHELFEVREVFSESIEGEALFKEPSVGDERAALREVFEPDVVNVVEIDV